jgi:3-oxoacyl-[acyl-carrier protein] reductase
MTKCWARELPREYGCTVNAVAPGPVDGPAINGSPEVFKKRLAGFTQATPVAPRLTQAAEVAWAVAMLCEDGAGWINGDIVNVSGGLHSF